ncbi:hypothetical protein GCM10023346_23960 [Arthrobacter gyeryongensis]|uniref:Uncharacterized protein n=1 Tax=Arthrobacter gyeryongensis TaxID=1650592 RepID=A0ABP9SEV8_9MICC
MAIPNGMSANDSETLWAITLKEPLSTEAAASKSVVIPEPPGPEMTIPAGSGPDKAIAISWSSAARMIGGEVWVPSVSSMVLSHLRAAGHTFLTAVARTGVISKRYLRVSVLD